MRGTKHDYQQAIAAGQLALAQEILDSFQAEANTAWGVLVKTTLKADRLKLHGTAFSKYIGPAQDAYNKICEHYFNRCIKCSGESKGLNLCLQCRRAELASPKTRL